MHPTLLIPGYKLANLLLLTDPLKLLLTLKCEQLHYFEKLCLKSSSFSKSLVTRFQRVQFVRCETNLYITREIAKLIRLAEMPLNVVDRTVWAHMMLWYKNV